MRADTEAIRKILKIQLGTKPVTQKDMKDLRAILIDLTAKLRSLVGRIPIPKHSTLASSGQATYPTEGTDSASGGPRCGEQYHTPVLAAFHKWARILLSLFVHKVGCSSPEFSATRLLTDFCRRFAWLISRS